MISCGMAPWCDQDYFARSCRADFDHIWGVPSHRHMQEWVGAPLDTRVHDVSSHKFWYKLCGLSYRGCASTQAHRHMQGWVAKPLNTIIQDVAKYLLKIVYLNISGVCLWSFLSQLLNWWTRSFTFNSISCFWTLGQGEYMTIVSGLSTLGQMGELLFCWFSGGGGGLLPQVFKYVTNCLTQIASLLLQLEHFWFSGSYYIVAGLKISTPH